MPSVRCPACDEVMEIEPDWYGRKVACPSCDKQFVARRPGESDEDEPDERPKRRRAWDEDEDEDDRPKRKRPKRRERPKPMSRGMNQLLLVGIIGGGILLTVLGCCGFAAYQVFKPVSYPEPWVTQSLPDGSYSVRFPKPPSADSVGFGDFGEHGTKWMTEEVGAADAVCMFGHVDNPSLPFDQWFEEDVAGIKAEVNARSTTPKAVTAAGLSGKEVEFKAGGAKVVYRVFDASRGGQRRYIMVMAGGRSMSDADRTKFLDSLKPGR